MQIIGHQKIIKFLEKSIESDAIAHAYLFSGREHLGKFSVAFDFAKKLSGATPGKINPDIIVITPDIEEKKGLIRKKNIGVEKIRELTHELSLTSHAGENRVAIVDEADLLTTGAQNALLKTLEEPEKKCIIILVAHNADKILATIKSRCVMKRFSLVNEEEISRFLPEGKNKKDILFWSMGRPGAAILMRENDNELAKRKEIQDELRKILKNNVSENFALAEALAKDSSALTQRLSLWAVILRRNILNVSREASGASLEKSLLLIEKLEEAGKRIRETNSNSRIILENLFLWLRQG
jgi:DNA polymerase-3 subunit delta'